MTSFVQIENNQHFVKPNIKLGKHCNNREIVTARVVQKDKGKFLFYIAIGKEIANILQFHAGDNLQVLIAKYNKNCLLLKKSDEWSGYRLIDHSKHANSNFLRLTILCNLPPIYKITQTTIIDYDINDGNLLYLDFKNLERSNADDIKKICT